MESNSTYPTESIDAQRNDVVQQEATPPPNDLLSGAKPDGDGGVGDETGVKETLPSPEMVTLDSIKLPDGQTRDDELGKAFLDIVNDGNLSRGEMAQKLVDMYLTTQGKFLEAQKAASDAGREALAEQIKAEDAEWVKAAMNHPEYGKDKWEASQAIIAKGRDMLATPELVKYFTDTHQGNNPDLLLMFYRAGKLMMEDQALRGAPAKASKNPADESWGALTRPHFDK